MDLDVGQLAEVGDGIQDHIGLALLHPVNLMLHQTEPGAAVHKSRAEDRHVMLVRQLDEAVVLLAMLGQVLAHLADEGAAGIGLGLQLVGDLVDREVAVLQLLLVDVGIVDTVDVEAAQRIVVGHFQRLVVLVAKAFEEIHVDDGGASGDHAIDHVAADQFRIQVHAPARAGGPGDDQENGAILVGQHLVVDVGGARQIAAGEAHLAHAVDDRTGIEAGDVDMLDHGGQQLCLAVAVYGVSHSLISCNPRYRHLIRQSAYWGRATQGRAR